MSRGGLYRHYPSTEAIFAAIIEDEQEQALARLRTAEKDGVSPPSILRVYLRSRVRLMLDPGSNIENAISEYAANSEEGKRLLVERARLCIDIIGEQIERGKKLELFTCADSAAAAKHIVWLLEGMTKHNTLMKVTETDIEQFMDEILVIIGYVGNKNKISIS